MTVKHTSYFYTHFFTQQISLEDVTTTTPATEGLLQAACFAYWSKHYRRRSLLFAIPNGGTRDKREAVQLKAQGVTAGVSDLALMLPAGRIVFIEMKNGKQALRDVQQQFKARATYLGHDTREAYSFADFAAILADLMPAEV